MKKKIILMMAKLELCMYVGPSTENFFTSV